MGLLVSSFSAVFEAFGPAIDRVGGAFAAPHSPTLVYWPLFCLWYSAYGLLKCVMLPCSGALGIPGKRQPCAFLDEAGVIADLFGERAHERIITEAEQLLQAVTLTQGRLEIMLGASFNAHDQVCRKCCARRPNRNPPVRKSWIS